jgi:molecular chaperone GrpE
MNEDILQNDEAPVEAPQDIQQEPVAEPDPAAEIASLKDQLLRRTAEMENMRKRQSRERVQLFEDAQVQALREFLPINDDLERALAAVDSQQVPEAFLSGIKLVADKFSNVLKSYGLTPIHESGVPFDVNVHEALMRQPAPTPETASNTVLMVLEPGYKLRDRVIRHAKVIVSE